jgi:DMSO/TMAO reductase YedYZ heme-binding membrane subunit
MHFVRDKLTKELIITIKIKWLNIILALISIGFIAVVILYAIVENSAERAIRKYDIEWRAK